MNNTLVRCVLAFIGHLFFHLTKACRQFTIEAANDDFGKTGHHFILKPSDAAKGIAGALDDIDIWVEDIGLIVTRTRGHNEVYFADIERALNMGASTQYDDGEGEILLVLWGSQLAYFCKQHDIHFVDTQA